MQFPIGKKLALCTGFLLTLFFISVVLTYIQTHTISAEITKSFDASSHEQNNDLTATRDSIQKKIAQLNFNAILLLLLGLISGLLSVILLTRTFSTPINQMITAMKDLTHWREYKPIEFHTNDEFKTLAYSFNEMAKEMQRAKTELQTAYRDQEMIVDERTRNLKESYQALAKLERRFSQLLNTSPAAIYALSLDIPRSYRFVSTEVAVLTGYEPDDITPDPDFWLSRIHPEDRKWTANDIEQAIASGSDVHIYRFKHKNGDYRWIRDIFRVVQDSSGKPLEIVGAWTDITNEKAATLALQASEERFRIASECSNDLIYEYDLVSGTLNWYGDVDGMLKYAPNEFPRTITAWEDSIHPDEQAALKAARKNHLADPTTPFDQQYRVRAKDGQYKIWRDRGKLELRDGLQTGKWIGSCADITKEKRLEQQFHQAQKMETVGLLAGGIAHDFNNLLTAIIGFSDMALQTQEPGATSREYIDEVKNAGLRAADLTRQLLAFSRKQVIAPTILELNKIVFHLEKMLHRLIGEDIQLVLTLDPALHHINADASQMEQIVMNLVVNARDAMPNGGEIIIETHNIELDKYYALTHPEVIPGHYVMLAISDTGSGISPEDQARIFEPFFTTKEKGKGTGLGLATVYGIVKQSGGYIYLYSKLGVGTTFRVYMPVAEPADKISAKTPDASHYMSKNNETILLVEDDASVRALAQMILENCGYKILAASSGDEALQLGAQHEGPINLLLTDVIMPNMNGKELSVQITLQRPETQVLFMSGYTGELITRHGILMEGMAFLPKPFTAVELARKTHEILRQQ